MSDPLERFRDKVPAAVLTAFDPDAPYAQYLTPRDLVDRYFRSHPRRTDRLAILLATKTGAPCGWSWERHIEDMQTRFWSRNFSFRQPPVPWQRHTGVGRCCLCGQPIYRFGWHQPWGGWKVTSDKAGWHAVCKTAYLRWLNPGHGIAAGHEADHFIPLYRVYRELGRTGRWPDILWYWSTFNIQILTTEEHQRKSAREAGERARFRVDAPSRDQPSWSMRSRA